MTLTVILDSIISEHIIVFRHEKNIPLEFQVRVPSQQFWPSYTYERNVLVLIFRLGLELALHPQMRGHTHERWPTDGEPLDELLALLRHRVQVALHLQRRGSTSELGSVMTLVRHVRRERFRIVAKLAVALQTGAPFRVIYKEYRFFSRILILLHGKEVKDIQVCVYICSIKQNKRKKWKRKAVPLPI